MNHVEKIYTCHELSEALKILRDNKNLRILSAGTDVLVGLRAGAVKATELLDIYSIEELKGIAFDGGKLHIGALTTHTQIAEDSLVNRFIPALARASSHVGSLQIRNRATIGGNICNASPAADTVPVLLAAGAEVKYARLADSSDGDSDGGSDEDMSSKLAFTTLPIADFMQGVRKTALPEDAILTEIVIPVKDRDKISFQKVGGRTSLAIAIVSVAMAKRDGEYIAAYGSMAPTVVRAKHVEQYLKERENTGNSETVDNESAGRGPEMAVLKDLLAKDLNPITDVRASAQYRIQAAAGITMAAWEELQ